MPADRRHQIDVSAWVPGPLPELEWADDIWKGLRDFSRPYTAVRSDLVKGLGGLGDHGAACVHEHHLGGDLSTLPNALSVKVHFKFSDENGRTKKHPQSRQDRTRSHCGTSKVFWWHAKLEPNVDRIHFLYEPPSADSTPIDQGQIVVGLFKKRCILP